MTIKRTLGAALLWLAAAACGGDGKDPAVAAEERTGSAVVLGQPDERMTPEQIRAGRRDPGWRRFVRMDTTAAQDTAGYPESWDDITPEAVNTEAMFVPLHGEVAGPEGEVAGPAVLRTQILLDRAYFSPGIIDGYWGKNTEKALYWFQEREGLPASGRVTRETFERLAEVAGNPREPVVRHTLTAEEVSGPFVDIPDDIYEKAELECMCYESLTEKLSELFHATPELLARLNPGVDLNALREGDVLAIPNVADRPPPPSAEVARLVVSDGGHYLHALDGQDRILYHFPTTLGADYAPSPTGDFRITAIAEDPTWHYQPDILETVPDHEEDAMIPAGPNNAVGVVWMQLSKPHYGIHGTSAPETIGYATSHGCVRLTNWDAAHLSDRVAEGTPVDFRDVDERSS